MLAADSAAVEPLVLLDMNLIKGNKENKEWLWPPVTSQLNQSVTKWHLESKVKFA